MRYAGQPGHDPSSLPLVEQRAVTPGFFEVTQQRLLAGRLLFGMDATASREPTWDVACQIQGEMFQETATLGGLDVNKRFLMLAAGVAVQHPGPAE